MKKLKVTNLDRMNQPRTRNKVFVDTFFVASLGITLFVQCPVIASPVESSSEHAKNGRRHFIDKNITRENLTRENITREKQTQFYFKKMSLRLDRVDKLCQMIQDQQQKIEPENTKTGLNFGIVTENTMALNDKIRSMETLHREMAELVTNLPLSGRQDDLKKIDAVVTNKFREAVKIAKEATQIPATTKN